MRIFFDALAATKYSGGMMLHATEIINSWIENFPNDDIAVLGGSTLLGEITESSSVQKLRWPNESILLRAPGQLFIEPALAAWWRANRVISLSPIVSPFVPSSKSVCFQHDWRHIRHPNEFSRLQRLYRVLWRVSARFAGINVCISQKAADETKRIVPISNTVVIPNGRDHARRWKNVSSRVSSDIAVTFGHHNNKRPDLVIRAWSRLAPDTTTTLLVLGARGEHLKYLEQLVRSLDLEDRVRFPGFVDDIEYEEIISSSRCVILASSDEGFGLPIAEAEYLGIPAVITNDIGVVELFPTAIVTAPTPDKLARGIHDALASSRSSHTVSWSWNDTVCMLRKLIIG
jgi:glycosyltransferase involved in cell wall biosynthesis